MGEHPVHIKKGHADALRFQELYYNERQHIAHLDQQRRAGFEDVLQEHADSLTV